MGSLIPKIIDWDNLRVAPWEKLPGEPSRSFAKFQHFRDMTPMTRTIAGCARELGIRRESLVEHQMRWHWIYRVDLWDQYLDAVARADQMEVIKQMNERHARTAMLILSKVGQRLVGDDTANIKAIDVNKLEPSDLARLTEVATKVERLARGAESERVGIHTTEEIGVKISFDTEPVYPKDAELDPPAVFDVEGEVEEIIEP